MLFEGVGFKSLCEVGCKSQIFCERNVFKSHGTKLAFENKFEAVCFDYAISVINLGFLPRAMLSNHMGTIFDYLKQKSEF